MNSSARGALVFLIAFLLLLLATRLIFMTLERFVYYYNFTRVIKVERKRNKRMESVVVN